MLPNSCRYPEKELVGGQGSFMVPQGRVRKEPAQSGIFIDFIFPTRPPVCPSLGHGVGETGDKGVSLEPQHGASWKPDTLGLLILRQQQDLGEKQRLVGTGRGGGDRTHPSLGWGWGT